MRPQQVPRPCHLDHLSDDSRCYPVISTVARDKVSADFGSINEVRKLALATFDWCAVCGLPFEEDESRWQAIPGEDWRARQRDGGWFVNEAPVHEICLLYAAQVCPYLSSPWHRMGDEFRAGQRREERISLVGFERTSQVLALRSGLQQDRIPCISSRKASWARSLTRVRGSWLTDMRLCWRTRRYQRCPTPRLDSSDCSTSTVTRALPLLVPLSWLALAS